MLRKKDDSSKYKKITLVATEQADALLKAMTFLFTSKKNEINAPWLIESQTITCLPIPHRHHSTHSSSTAYKEQVSG